MSTMFSRPWMRHTALGSVVLKIWLVSAQAVFAIGQSAHDDRLFLRLANTFLDGQWLGAYNQYTLAKGPAYSVFVGFSVATGLPLPLAQHLLYILACWLAVRAVRPLLAGDGWAFALFLLLLWQPMTYQASVLTRVMRQHLYVAATLLVFAGLAALYTRAAASRRVRFGWAALLGLAWGVVWLTREESIWIVPVSFLVPVAAIATRVGFHWRHPREWFREAQPVMVAVVMAALPILAVCAMNARNYGWWGTVEFRAPEFLRAYGSLSRIRVGTEIRGVPLTRAGREAIYEVSPAFAELRPWLEGQLGVEYARHSFPMTGLPPEQREMAGGWWMWALRDAVAFAGHGRSAREALDFYQRLADEINAACDRGDLPAGPPRATMFPPWQSRYTGDFFADLPRFVAAVVFFTDFNAEVPPSQGDADQLRLFRDLTQWYISPAPEAPVFDTPTGTIARSYRVGALNIAGRVMGWMCSAVVLGGLLAWPTAGIRSARRRCWPSFTWWLAAGCLGTTAAIVLINLLVNVTSFPQFGPGAFAQAYPLMVLFGVLAVRDLLTPDAPRSGASEL